MDVMYVKDIRQVLAGRINAWRLNKSRRCSSLSVRVKRIQEKDVFEAADIRRVFGICKNRLVNACIQSYF
jgi:hypothetical protein